MPKKKDTPVELGFRAVFERRGRWVIGSSPDVPGANAQERTLAAARKSLIAAVRDLIELDPRLARRLKPVSKSLLAEETLVMKSR